LSLHSDRDVLEAALDNGSLSAFNAAAREPDGKEVRALDRARDVLLTGRPTVVPVHPSKSSASKQRQRADRPDQPDQATQWRSTFSLGHELDSLTPAMFLVAHQNKSPSDSVQCVFSSLPAENPGDGISLDVIFKSTTKV
jgi:hypothetical protein